MYDPLEGGDPATTHNNMLYLEAGIWYSVQCRVTVYAPIVIEEIVFTALGYMHHWIYIARFFEHCHVQMLLYMAMIVHRLLVCLTMPIYDGCLESRSDVLVCLVV